MKTSELHRLLFGFLVGFSAFVQAEILRLDDCVEKAVRNNPDIRNAILSYKQNKADNLKLLGRYIPGLGGSLVNNHINEPSAANSFASFPIDATSFAPSLSMGLPGGGFVKAEYSAQDSTSPSKTVMPGLVLGGPSYTYKFGLSFTQPLLQNFLLIPSDINVLRMASSSRKIAKYVIFQAAEGVAYSAYMNYINLIINKANVVVKSNSLERARNLLKRNLENRALGLVEDTDILGSKALLNIRDTDFSTTKNAEIGIINTLKQLMDDPADFDVADEISLQCNVNSDLTAGADEVRTALSNRIELKLLREQEKLLRINILMAKGQLLPQLNLIGSWSLYGNKADKAMAYETMSGGENDSWMIGLNLNMPLLPLSSFEDLKKQELELEKVRNNIRKTELQIRNQVLSQKESLILLQRQLSQMEEAVQYQKERLQKEDEKFRLGRSSSRFLIQAQDDLENAETQMLAMRWRFYIGIISLEYAKGVLLKSCNSALYSSLDQIK
jgi:outer membrane protein TolC